MYIYIYINTHVNTIYTSVFVCEWWVKLFWIHVSKFPKSSTGLIECSLPLALYKPQTLVCPNNRVRFEKGRKHSIRPVLMTWELWRHVSKTAEPTNHPKKMMYILYLHIFPDLWTSRELCHTLPIGGLHH